MNVPESQYSLLGMVPGTYLYDFIMYRRFRAADPRDADARQVRAPRRYHRRII